MIDFDAPDSYREEPKKIPEQQIIIPEQNSAFRKNNL